MALENYFDQHMKIAKPFFFFFLLISIMNLINGCATLPNVSEKIDATPAAREPRQIVSAKGLLSQEKSKDYHGTVEEISQSDGHTGALQCRFRIGHRKPADQGKQGHPAY